MTTQWHFSGTPGGSLAPMSALAGLVDKGLVAPDWAEALAPVDDRIAAMGRFLREEIAAGSGRTCPRATRSCAPSSGRSPTSACWSSGRTRIPRRGTRSGSASRSTRTSGRCRAAWRTSTRSCAPTSAIEPPRARRPDRLGGPGRDAAEQGAHRPARRARVAPRPRLGGRHRVRDHGTGEARRPVRRDPVGPRRPVAQADAGADPLGRVGAPVAAVGEPGFFGSRPFTRVNRLLVEQGGEAVDWSLPME